MTTYLVVGKGQLGRYPITLDTGTAAAQLQVTLTKSGQGSAAFQLTSTQALSVKATFEAANGAYYVLKDKGGGAYELQKAASGTAGALKTAGGKVSFTVKLAAASSVRKLPSSFEARAFESGTVSAIKVQAQNPKVSDYANVTTLNISNRCQVWLGSDGDRDDQMTQGRASAIRAGDYLKIKVDGMNKVVEIRAYRGQITGTVVSVKEASLKGATSNAAVTIRDAAGKSRTFEIGTECRLQFAGRTGD